MPTVVATLVAMLVATLVATLVLVLVLLDEQSAGTHSSSSSLWCT